LRGRNVEISWKVTEKVTGRGVITKDQHRTICGTRRRRRQSRSAAKLLNFAPDTPSVGKRNSSPPLPAGILFQDAFALADDVQEGICHAMLALRAATDVIIHKIQQGRAANNSHLAELAISYQPVGGRRSRHGEDPTPMYVCLCNALTDRQVKQAAATAGTTKPSSVYAACGCRAQCGQCVKALLALLRGTDRAMPELQGAD
jgi:bacterioferritin-associated ferredoxin